jgi:hypoxanthine-DNA glycosylase
VSHVQSFAPVCGGTPRVLILGSMPGVASLRAGQYYAHPRNAFWPLMEALFGIRCGLDYAERTAALVRHGIALWDVLASCNRPGSLDASIDPASVRPNDIGGLVARYPTIETLFFNGQMAETVFRRHLLPALGEQAAGLVRCRLPSTSPANAGWSFERKLAAWQQVRMKARLRAEGAR